MMPSRAMKERGKYNRNNYNLYIVENDLKINVSLMKLEKERV